MSRMTDRLLAPKSGRSLFAFGLGHLGCGGGLSAIGFPVQVFMAGLTTPGGLKLQWYRLILNQHYSME